MRKGLVFGIVIFIIAIGVILYINKPTSNQPNANQELVDTIQKFQNGDKSGEWKTYRNGNYSFEIQYPPYGFITADTWRYSADYGDYYMIEFRIPSPPALFVDVEPKKNCEKYNFQNSNMTLDGIPAIKDISKSSDGTEFRKVHFIKGEQCYAIQMIGPEFEDAEKMLTTFKFY